MIQKKEPDTETKKKKKPLSEDDDEQPVDKKKKKEKEKDPPANDETETNSKAEILNNVVVHETGGLTASRAYLSFEDGKLVSKNNRVPLGTPVYLHLLIESGWKLIDGMVSLDASERIVSDGGELVLHAPNLFKETPSVEESKANHIYLKAAITKTRADINYFIVNYRLWDKQGDGEIKGSYKLYIDEARD